MVNTRMAALREREIGNRYGRLRVLAIKHTSAICVCDCGKLYTATLTNLRQGITKACSAHAREWSDEYVESPKLDSIQVAAILKRPRPYFGQPSNKEKP